MKATESDICSPGNISQTWLGDLQLERGYCLQGFLDHHNSRTVIQTGFTSKGQRMRSDTVSSFADIDTNPTPYLETSVISLCMLRSSLVRPFSSRMVLNLDEISILYSTLILSSFSSRRLLPEALKLKSLRMKSMYYPETTGIFS